MNEFYCPLVSLILSPDINIKNYELEISKEVKIVCYERLPSLSVISEELSKTKLNYIKKDVYYWLCLDYNSSEEIQIIVNIFQLASWIVIPTELQIWFISYISKGESKKPYFIDLRKFEYIPNHVEWCFDKKSVQKLKKIFPVLLEMYKNKPIFYTAIGLNYQGCVAHHWDAAYILYVTTFEALLTHKSNWGIKKKLAWAYAILTETEVEERQKAFDDFRDIYKIRSKILHGESFEYKDEDEDNDGKLYLKDLAKCRDMLRKLWQVILDSKEIIEKLSGDDKVRREYFKKVANGWVPEENEKQE